MFTLTATLLVLLAQQQPTPPVVPPDLGGLPLNLTLTQWVMIMFGTIGLAALGKSIIAVIQGVASMIKSYADSFPKRLEGDQKAKEAAVKAEEVDTANVEEVTKQLGMFITELARRDDLLEEERKQGREERLKFAETLNNTQRLSNEQREQFNQERSEWRADKATMTDLLTVKDVALEALTKENIQLKADNERLQRRVFELELKLKRHATDEVPAVPPQDANAAAVSAMSTAIDEAKQADPAPPAEPKPTGEE